MADIHQPSDRRAPTTGELATLPRITRSRFIGNAIGALLLVAVVVGIYVAIGMNSGANPALFQTLTPKPGTTIVVPSPAAILVFALLYLCVFIDLAVRRRHDRNRSGVEVIMWAEIAVGALVLHLFGPPAIERLGFDAAAAVLSLWLLFVLIFLRGTRGSNLYGEDPITMLRRAGH